jgi:hypothetical protein
VERRDDAVPVDRVLDIGQRQLRVGSGVSCHRSLDVFRDSHVRIGCNEKDRQDTDRPSTLLGRGHCELAGGYLEGHTVDLTLAGWLSLSPDVRPDVSG